MHLRQNFTVRIRQTACQWVSYEAHMSDFSGVMSAVKRPNWWAKWHTIFLLFAFPLPYHSQLLIPHCSLLITNCSLLSPNCPLALPFAPNANALKTPKTGQYGEHFNKRASRGFTFLSHRLLKSKIKRKFAGLYIYIGKQNWRDKIYIYW